VIRRREYTTGYLVPSSRDLAERLTRLDLILQILGQGSSTPAAPVTDADAAQVHLAGVPIERIRRLTAELSDGARTPDELDTVLMRLLLNDFATGVTHLRAVARIAASRVDAAAGPMREARRALHRHSKSIEAGTPNWLAKKQAVSIPIE
jgi:hypothetical protein